MRTLGVPGGRQLRGDAQRACASCTSSTSHPSSTRVRVARPGAPSGPRRREPPAAPSRAPPARAHRARPARHTAGSRRRGRTGRRRRRAGRCARRRRRARVRAAFSRASSSAASEASVATTRAPGCSCATASAIAPLPVPTSSTRGASDAADQLEAALDDDLRLGPRHERARVGAQRQAAEVPVAEHVRERLTRAPPLHELACSVPLRLGQRPVVLRVELDPREAERAREQPLRIEPRALDATFRQVVGRAGEHLAERHRSSARRCSSAVSASVKSSSDAGEHLLERHVQLDAVVGDAALREVVGPDLLGARAGADLCAAGGRLLGRLTLALGLVDARAQHAHRLLAVLQLRALVLHRDDDPGRQVRDAHRGVGRVDGLAARAGRAVDVDLQVALLDLDVHLLRLRHHGDRRGRRVDASLRLGLGHALDAMRPAFELEDRVGAVALDRERRLLDAARVARRHLDLLPAEAAPLGVALQQPREIAGPELPLVAALAAADLDDHVLLVGGVALGERELQLLLEPRDVGLVVADHLGELGVAARRVEVLARLLPLLRELPRPLELLQAPADVGRLTVVVVDRRDRTSAPAPPRRTGRAPPPDRRVPPSRPEVSSRAARRG